MKSISKVLVAALLSTSISIPVAHAGGRDFIGGAIVGVGGTLLLQQLNKNNKKRTSNGNSRTGKAVQRSSRRTIAEVATTRDEVRDYQVRLNQLGFDAGTPDGVAGKRTRNAVRGFQQSIGAPVTGILSQSDSATLIQSTSQQIAGIQPGSQQAMAAFPMTTAPTFGDGLAPVPNQGASGQPSGIAGTLHATFPTISAPQMAATTANTPGIGASAFGQPAPAFPLAKSAAPAQANPVTQAFPKLGTAPAPTTLALGAPAAQTPTFTVPANAIPVNAVPDTDAIAAPLSNFSTTDDTASVAASGQVASLAPVAAPASPRQQAAPSIFGISPGLSYAQSQTVLANEGFENCFDDGKLLVCEKDNGAMNDRVVIGRTGNGANAAVYMTARELVFTEPVRMEFIATRLNEAYPGILSQPDHRLAEDSCKAFIAASPVGSFDPTLKQVELSEELLTACPTYYAVNFDRTDDGQMVESAVITLFDAAILNADSTRLTKQENELDKKLKF